MSRGPGRLPLIELLIVLVTLGLLPSMTMQMR
jgi:hypothetical protein